MGEEAGSEGRDAGRAEGHLRGGEEGHEGESGGDEERRREGGDEREAQLRDAQAVAGEHHRSGQQGAGGGEVGESWGRGGQGYRRGRLVDGGEGARRGQEVLVGAVDGLP